jgi:hypothetical protein
LDTINIVTLVGGALLSRIVEAYVGEYASGKSECAVNRALHLLETEADVTLVDLDFVEPFYTLRPIREELKERGLGVVAWVTEETLGLGEAGSLMKPEMRWVLRRPGNIILDIGYGVKGAKILNLIEGADEDPDLKIFAVINSGRPLTSSFEDVRDYILGLGPVHGLINNSHLGDDTDIDFIQEGAKMVTAVAKSVGLPVIATCADERFKMDLGELDVAGNPVRYLKRYMPRTFW